MLSKINATLQWVPYYFFRKFFRNIQGGRHKPKHVHICICDHFEPYWNRVDRKIARGRIQRWIDGYPKIADKYRDSDGSLLKYTFFYPEEEYRLEDMNALAELCHAGYGEVEIHLHHDNDTSVNLRRTLNDYKRCLHEQHGLLSIDRQTKGITYGFIHGNWALDNSNPDGRWCGVNDEISLLLETGCYADFTMPSAPSPTQTRKVNSIYYAIDDPMRPKSHDQGQDIVLGKSGEGLLMVQGPLGLAWHSRKYGIIPRIENSGLLASNPANAKRFESWVAAGIGIAGAPEHIFIKLYTHGTQEQNIQMFFDDNGLKNLFLCIEEYKEKNNVEIHYLSAREMVNVIFAIEKGEIDYEYSMREFKNLKQQ